MEIYRKHMLEKYNVSLPEDATVNDFIKAYIEAKQARIAIAYPQQMNFINIIINSICNLNCYSCDQFIDTAPAKKSDSMTLRQIEDFVKESQDLNWQWHEIRITGGEPTLHHDFFKILDTINKGLKQKYLPDLTLKIISNGTGKKVRKILDIENANLMKFNRVTDGFDLSHIGHPDWLIVCSKPLKDTMEKTYIEESINFKTGEKKLAEFIPDFGNVWQAPIDRLDEIEKMHKGSEEDIANPPLDGYYPPNLTTAQAQFVKENNIILDCQMHASCGWELSRAGFRPCSGGGGRVLANQEDYFDSLSDITIDECNKKLARMCLTCGQNFSYSVPCSKRKDRTEFWQLALTNYALNKPKLKAYDPFNRNEDEDR
jgi:organic radical activating enzyme